MLHLLFVQGAAAVGERAVLPQGVGEFRVEPVGQAGWDSLPDQDENHDDSRLTRVSCSLAHQAEQLLLLTASADYLHVQQHTPQSPSTNDAILNVKRKRVGNLSITVCGEVTSTCILFLLVLLLISSLLVIQSVFPHCDTARLPIVFNEADSKRLTDGMESCGGGNQLYKSSFHALIQQDSSPESVLRL